MSLTDHVVICGFGRVGRRIAEFLKLENIAFIGLDADPQAIDKARSRGENVVFGNADRAEVLIAAGIGRARRVW